MSKTQKSLSDDSEKTGRPKDFKITVRKMRVSAGAGFLIAYCGKLLTMPGLPKKPSAELIDLNDEGVISGLF
jgi:formate--tetrahydrofolate ligase